MILSLQAFAPAALLLAGGIWLLVRPGANVFVLLQVLALAALVRVATLGAAALTVPVYTPLRGLPLVLRFDGLSLFMAISAVASVLLLSLPWINDRERHLPFGWLALGELGAVGGILAGDLPGLAVGWGFAVAALLMLVLMPHPRAGELVRPTTPVARTLVLQLGAAAVLLAGAVGVEALAGTTTYDAIPVGALDSRTGLLLVASPLLVLATLAGLIRACRRPATAAVMVCGVLLPLATYLLARTYDLAQGRPLPGSVSAGLVVGGGVGATLYALYSRWAPVLGSTVARLLSSLGLLLVVGFASGGPAALAALLTGFLALEAAAAGSLVLLDTAGGRLPGRGRLPRPVMAMLALVPPGILAGLAVGLALDSRLLVARHLLDQGTTGVLLALPVMVATLLVAAGAFAATRFGGGTVPGVRGVVQLVLLAVAAMGLQLASPRLLDRVTELAAAASHAPLADVRSTARTAVPGGLAGSLVIVLSVALLAGAALAPGFYTVRDGVRVAPDLLPPRIAVTPEIALRRAVAGAAVRAKKVGGTMRAHSGVVVAGAWALAAALVMLGSR
ncbi:MAG: hypothetical protein NVSMB17_16340 [Candidatus Dormibacteria bacterium]